MKKISFKTPETEPIRFEVELELKSGTVILDLTEPLATLYTETDKTLFDAIENYLRNDKNKEENFKLLKAELTTKNLNILFTQINEEMSSKKK